ncbi:hypothetical protein COW82_03125 [Candidatus Campbellbacteria bacterium CG22_combo_CG10-13_8_21_14_all_43_18]|uniref:Uncharacterized protein n=1 Tax=Candidatus Campbellbacteria bacterium CG22_combo_CG10-13_8_21_14_all_43_18 TaxID=1974530 RepID=A0A2H0DWJ9_9BACT|nr:MAG: hypothetical protein COW82_03125 [Candidatus Campbellbacteria bacterium CG22_combo_CG10-13_8_21_14_all_43_18]
MDDNKTLLNADGTTNDREAADKKNSEISGEFIAPKEGSDEAVPQERKGRGALAGPLAVLLLFAAFIVFNDGGVQEVTLNNTGGNDSASESFSEDAAALFAVSNETIGDFLVDKDGMTLYEREAECSGDCLDNWPPYLYDGEPVLGELGLVSRKDSGELQYTYNDAPLYYFVGDTAPGDFNGHGQNGWSIVRPN